jgi:hypothetical protein
MPTDIVTDIPAPPDATEVFDWTQHGPDLARRPFTGAVLCEAAALDLIVQLPRVVICLPDPEGLTAVLQDYAGALHAEGAFAGVGWDDAKQIAAAVAFDVVMRDDAADFLRGRAARASAGTDNMPWHDRAAAARAMNIAATVFGL